MVSGNDHLESFFNSLSLQAVKVAFSPLESGIRRAALDLESRFGGCSVKSVEVCPKFSVVVVDDDERKKGLSIRVPLKSFWGNLFQNSGSSKGRNGVEVQSKEVKERGVVEDEGSCVNCLQFAFPFIVAKKRSQKHCRAESVSISSELERKPNCKRKGTKVYNDGEILSLQFFLGLKFDQFIQNVQKFDQGIQQFDHLGAIKGILKGGKEDFNCFLGNLRFARVGGAPPSLVGDVGVTSVKDGGEDSVTSVSKEEVEISSTQRIAYGLLSIPLSNVERLRSTLSTVSLTELIELIPQLGRPSTDYPDKKKLFSVQDFFRYTETEGRRFFEELDRDGDGQVTLEDLEIAMRKRKLPRRYAREFMRRTRSHLFSKSFGWKQFLSFMEQKEPTILRAYTTLCLSKSGTLQKNQILTSLKNAGLPANEDNAVAMMRFLNGDVEGSISYGHFRNFMLLLPSDRLQDDPRSIWFESATVVAVAPPVEIPAGSVMKSALAGGLASALSTSLLHPVDSIKTRVQASTLSFPELIAKLPQIGVQGLYRGCIPAIFGQFTSHGLRTGIFEASKLVLINVAPTLPEIQVQSIASFCSTIMGTAVRIPCEVMKQRLQAGIFDNVGEAFFGTLRQDGVKGFFRGTGATLCREVPFYVAGMCLYAESKKAAEQFLGRELEPWETISVGALSGGFAAVVTTPFDVLKTRMMTAPQGLPVSMSMIAFSILRHEGPLGLFKGAIPRFFWIAPLGAMNFAGYELARKAMNKTEDPISDQPRQKSLAGASSG
ncbi:hypothetical protein GIB67_030322 [Kingdonia uniflora]|uniref:EF-hand domain-containing protein n=1 Tax=Kingdonia uniflora TaxID=39325 RepID=A0A7J7M6K0_9MAGN|nr:hypothetical protein GIB67_030322 [Kingdonia uniflora]